MTTDQFRYADLDLSPPRMLPEPFLAAALFISSSSYMMRDVDVFLDAQSVPVTRRQNLWMTLVYDESKGGEAVAQAAYSWLDQRVVREALFIHPDYANMNFESFLDGMGSALFGGQPVCIPLAAVDGGRTRDYGSPSLGSR